MPAGLEDLLHDAAVLHSFADFIEQYCGEQERSQRYVDASGDFFRYAERLARGIKQNLRDEVKRASRFPQRIATLRRNMLTLKNYLRLLHTIIKPAADAHTLSIPAPLVDLARDQLQHVQGMNGANLVILLTPQLMYLQRPHTHLKGQARQVQTFIPQPTFPKKLGFIELPYSQGPSFFTNLALYHEIGHFVYEELSTLHGPNTYLAALNSAMAGCLKKAFRRPPKDPKIRAVAEKIVGSWTQEIFCDLFAIRLAGPAFSFALVEILGMLGFLSPETRVKFDEEHPASACRFAQHVSLLREDSWWEAIADIEPEQKTLLNKLANIPRSEYTFYVDEDFGPKGLMNAFLDSVVPAIRKVIRKITPAPTEAVKQFKQSRPSIENCLWAGVVPHTKAPSPTDPVSIINTAFCFYLTSLPKLLTKFEGSKAKNNVDKHSLWTGRLENWTRKAIEDSQIQARFRR